MAPDPITHATPYIVIVLTTLSSFLFGLPLGVVISAAGGAYWAVYRNQSLSFLKSAWLILCGMAIAAVLVEGVNWLAAHAAGLTDLPQRPLAFITGFAIIDKQFRDWLIAQVQRRLQAPQDKP